MGEAGDFNAEWDPPTAVQNEHLNANWEAVSQPSSAPRDPVVGPGHAPGAPFRPAVAAPVQPSVPAEGAPTMMQPAKSGARRCSIIQLATAWVMKYGPSQLTRMTRSNDSAVFSW